MCVIHTFPIARAITYVRRNINNYGHSQCVWVGPPLLLTSHHFNFQLKLSAARCYVARTLRRGNPSVGSKVDTKNALDTVVHVPTG